MAETRDHTLNTAPAYELAIENGDYRTACRLATRELRRQRAADGKADKLALWEIRVRGTFARRNRSVA